jgi:predicted cupin superfamily sugar epimerase
MHRLVDEVWHFYLGGPPEAPQISPHGSMTKTILGPDVKEGQKGQHVFPAGYWFAARPAAGSAYSFVGCTVAPSFDFEDFELAEPEDLSRCFPVPKEEILPSVCPQFRSAMGRFILRARIQRHPASVADGPHLSLGTI